MLSTEMIDQGVPEKISLYVQVLRRVLVGKQSIGGWIWKISSRSAPRDARMQFIARRERPDAASEVTSDMPNTAGCRVGRAAREVG